MFSLSKTYLAAFALRFDFGWLRGACPPLLAVASGITRRIVKSHAKFLAREGEPPLSLGLIFVMLDGRGAERSANEIFGGADLL